MKKWLVWAMLVCLLTLTAACDRLQVSGAGVQEMVSDPVAPVGEVPPEFAEIVAENRFGDVCQYGDKLVRLTANRLEWVDMAGETIAACDIPAEDDLLVKTDSLRSTSDGGVIFALGFQDRYKSDTQSWASEAGFASKVIKLDEAANVQWIAELPGVEGGSLWSCIETEDGYCFFGEVQTPETKRLGVYSRTDLSVLKLDRQGKLLFTRTYGGSDYDSFYRVEESASGYAVYVSSQSNDGLFEGRLPEGKSAASWRVLLDRQFNVTGMEPVGFALMSQTPSWGYTDADTARNWEKLEARNAAGMMLLALDYGDFTLIVSENNIGIKETPVMMSMRLYETETVYSAWQNGRLIWRAAHDNR